MATKRKKNSKAMTTRGQSTTSRARGATGRRRGRPRKSESTLGKISPQAEQKRESGAPGGGAGRRDEVGGSGVYPASAGNAPADAEVRDQASWGQGERGAQGYNDSGDSELWYGAPNEGGVGISETATNQMRAGMLGPRGGEIPREDWVSFFDGFSKQHEGWIVSLEVTDANGQRRVEARDLPLQGVAANLKHGGEDTISIILARRTDDLVTHNIAQTTRVGLNRNAEGADEGLELDSATGEKALLRFRSPALPETVDGIAS